MVMDLLRAESGLSYLSVLYSDGSCPLITSTVISSSSSSSLSSSSLSSTALISFDSRFWVVYFILMSSSIFFCSIFSSPKYSFMKMLLSFVIFYLFWWFSLALFSMFLLIGFISFLLIGIKMGTWIGATNYLFWKTFYVRMLL